MALPMILLLLFGVYCSYANRVPQDLSASLELQLRKQQLATLPACAKAIQHSCNATSALEDNFEAIRCLQKSHELKEPVGPVCQHAIWLLKYNLTHDSRFEVAANSDGICGPDLARHPSCHSLPHGRGLRLSCLSERFNNLAAGGRADFSDPPRPACRRFLNRIASVAFVSDFRPAGQFINVCLSDIRRLACGRFSLAGAAGGLHSQSEVVRCLLGASVKNSTEGPGELGESCRAHVRRLTLLESDQFYGNPRLLGACLDDAESRCLTDEHQIGNGGLVSCLLSVQAASPLSADCRSELRRQDRRRSGWRASLGFDYKVRRQFADACRADAVRLSCSESTVDLLTCLGAASESLQADCWDRMLLLRSALLFDPAGDPGVLAACPERHLARCQLRDSGSSFEAGPVLCIAGAAAAAAETTCGLAAGRLLRAAFAAAAGSAGTQLAAACLTELLSNSCPVSSSLDEALACLSDSAALSPKCDEGVAQLRFFQTAAFNISCSVRRCRSSNDRVGASACLYRSLLANELSDRCAESLIQGLEGPKFESRKLSAACAVDIWRRRRGDRSLTSFDLLARLGKGPPLSAACKALVRSGGRSGSVGVASNGNHSDTLDRAVVDHCLDYAKRHCSATEAGSSALSCLLNRQASPDMPRSCKAALQHQQLLWLPQPRFTAAFAEACKSSLMANCRAAVGNAAAVRCLSAIVLSDTLAIQAAESPTLGPAGLPAEIVKPHQHRVDEACRRRLVDDLLRPGVDDQPAAPVQPGSIGGDRRLLRDCQRMAFLHCRGADELTLLACLSSHLSDADFDGQCRLAVSRLLPRAAGAGRLQRLISGDLRTECGGEMNSRCRDVLREASRLPVDAAAADAAGVQLSLLRCLRSADSAAAELRPACRRVVQRHLAEHSIDKLLPAAGWEQNRLLADCRPVLLAEGCAASLSGFDSPQLAAQAAADCLRRVLSEGRIPANAAACREAAAGIAAGQRHVDDSGDVHSDTALVRACAADLRTHCGDVSPGGGRLMACLARLSSSSSPQKKKLLSDECRARLAERLFLARAAVTEEQRKQQQQMQDVAVKVQSAEASAVAYHVTFLSVCLTAASAAVAFWIGRRLRRLSWRRVRRWCRLR
ncbi:hypothetical protein BOX15_Mlig022329g2 [Macrostomum lignano]|uniref:Golgi apparatus protein 1 n=1 Tax=Macrostomum lignano TaxID=282301 RepID=A0A267E0G0_9PLAT|nr:hypothetical protein BOX15_Mlig022329g2 [Macrostomum lignano]